MKVKLKEIVNSVAEVRELRQLKFKASLTFSLVNFMNHLNKEMQSYEEVRNKKILEYSTDKKKVDDDKIPLFMDEMNSLLEKEIEVPDFKLKESDFSGSDISPDHIFRLKWLIE